MGAHPEPIAAAVLAVAGPVGGQRAEVTNLGWTVEWHDLDARFPGASVILKNDLEALAAAVPHLRADQLHTLSRGEAVSGGAIAVAAPGTGLGEAYLTWNGREYVAHPSEGGHASFSPTTPEQIDLLASLLAEHGHVSTERVASGLGIPAIYDFIREAQGLEEPGEVAEAVERAADPTPEIVDAAVSGRSAICIRVLELFVEILGAELGNLALKVLATGGIYLGGGIPPRILSFLDHERFLRAFRGKGRHEALLSRVPVHVVLDRDAVLDGAARRAQRLCAMGEEVSSDEDR